MSNMYHLSMLLPSSLQLSCNCYMSFYSFLSCVLFGLSWHVFPSGFHHNAWQLIFLLGFFWECPILLHFHNFLQGHSISFPLPALYSARNRYDDDNQWVAVVQCFEDFIHFILLCILFFSNNQHMLMYL